MNTVTEPLAFIYTQLRDAGIELRAAADRDRQNILQRELALETIKRNALAEACRAKVPYAYEALDLFNAASLHLLVLPCGCIHQRLDYHKRWAIECNSHRQD